RRKPRCCAKWRQARRGTQAMVNPCQVSQRRMAPFAAQPLGPGLFLRDAAFLVAYLERPNCTPRALPRAKTGYGAAAYETGTDPRGPLSANQGRWPIAVMQLSPNLHGAASAAT